MTERHTRTREERRMILPRGTLLYRCPPRCAGDPLTVSGNGECGSGLYTSLSARIAEHYPLRDMLTFETTRALTLLDRSTPDGERTFQDTGMRGYDGIYFNRFGDAEVVLASAADLMAVPCVCQHAGPAPCITCERAGHTENARYRSARARGEGQ